MTNDKVILPRTLLNAENTDQWRLGVWLEQHVMQVEWMAYWDGAGNHNVIVYQLTRQNEFRGRDRPNLINYTKLNWVQAIRNSNLPATILTTRMIDSTDDEWTTIMINTGQSLLEVYDIIGEDEE